MCNPRPLRRHPIMKGVASIPIVPRPRISAMLALIALGAAGCILPVSYTHPASPAVIGWYRRSDGTPAAGARVVVTTDGDGRACRRPLGVGITDSAGVFQLAPAMVQRRGVWLVPAFERFTNDYWICVSSADSVLFMAYRGVMFLRSADTAAPAV